MNVPTAPLEVFKTRLDRPVRLYTGHMGSGIEAVFLHPAASFFVHSSRWGRVLEFSPRDEDGTFGK